MFKERLEKDDIWLAIWKVEKSKAESNNIGISMLDYAISYLCLNQFQLLE